MSTDRYAVMGNPIGHSKSPQIHSQFAHQTRQAISYEAILVGLEEFDAAVDRFQQAGGKGLNITVPFKREAWELVSERSDRAELAGAVNTLLLREDGRRYADNTDGVGLVRDLTVNHKIALRDKRILMLGAGGAVRGVLAPLLEQAPAHLLIANRTDTKAVELARLFVGLGAVSGCGFDDLGGEQFDLVINATSASLEGQVPPLPDDILAAGGSCYDLMYSDVATPFQRWAQARGAAQAIDGLGMLVEQAAESFLLWRGVRPETQPVIARLRTQMAL